MKMAGDIHAVPLSPKAVTLLEQIQAITGKFELVFAGDAKPWKPMSENTVKPPQDGGLLHQGGYLRPWVPSNGVQCVGRVRAMVGDGYRTTDEPLIPTRASSSKSVG